MFADSKRSLSCATKRAGKSSPEFNHYTTELVDFEKLTNWLFWTVWHFCCQTFGHKIWMGTILVGKKKNRKNELSKKFNLILRMIFRSEIALSMANRISHSNKNRNRLSRRFLERLPHSHSLSLSLPSSSASSFGLPHKFFCIYLSFSRSLYACLATHDWFVVVLVIYGRSRARLLWGPDDFYRFD